MLEGTNTLRAVPRFAAGGLITALAALFLSGVAGIVNQVVWQRALKIFLGGSETLSSLVVVLVFMLGLGIGAGVMGRRAGRVLHPLRVFAGIELGLFALNTAIALVLALDLTQTLYSAERLAVSAGVPLRLIYTFGALAILLPPTVLMGATIPIAAEVCQKQFQATQARLITWLFFLNTIGAVAGALGASFYGLPYLGQRATLLIAAALNLSAGLALMSIALRTPPIADRVRGATAARPIGALPRRPFTSEEKLAAALGFASLGYEIYLLRVMVLAHEPLPYTFAFTLCCFLLFWSAGVYASGWLRGGLRLVMLAAAASVAVMPGVYAYDRWHAEFQLFVGGLSYFIPCIFFGLLYGTLVSRSAQEWGRDVGRFYALNTLGSCLGILFFTLVGYEIRHDWNAFLIALVLVALVLQLMLGEARTRGAGGEVRLVRPVRLVRLVRIAQSVVALVGIGLLVMGFATPHSSIRGAETYWGRDGVVEIKSNGGVFIDGLWHSQLSDGLSHIGPDYSWLLVVAAVLAHRDEPIRDALVVGNGVGISAATLAKIDGIQVDAYEINHTLQSILRDYPKGALGVGELPNVEIRWRDGRSGMALDLKKYDLIVSAPLHLRQAGSSILLSLEYMELARRRLKERGVFAFYSREAGIEQLRLVQTTVRSVFPYVETFKRGQLTVASDTPIEITLDTIAQRLRRKDPLYQEMAEYDRRSRNGEIASRRWGRSGLFGFFDSERRSLQPSPYLISDDHPLVEYTQVVKKLLAASRSD